MFQCRADRFLQICFVSMNFHAPHSKACSMKRSFFNSAIASSQISSTSSCSIEEEVNPSSPTLSWERSRVLDCDEFQAFLSAEVVHNRALSATSAAATSVPVFSAMFGSRLFDSQVLRLIAKALIQPLNDSETDKHENNLQQQQQQHQQQQQQEQRSPIL
jgi:hypothetical protein